VLASVSNRLCKSKRLEGSHKKPVFRSESNPVSLSALFLFNQGLGLVPRKL